MDSFRKVGFPFMILPCRDSAGFLAGPAQNGERAELWQGRIIQESSHSVFRFDPALILSVLHTLSFESVVNSTICRFRLIH